MSKVDNALEHILNVIRREVNDTFPDLTLHFVINESTNLPDHPGSEPTREYMQGRAPNKMGVIRMAVTSEKKFPYITKKESFLATCDVSEDALRNENENLFPDNPDKYHRLVGYRLAWNAIDVYLRYKSKDTDTITISDSGMVGRTLNPADMLRINLNNECFATMIMEMKGEKGLIQKLMKKRSELSLSKMKHSRPELHPFPISYDATRIVFDELSDAREEKADLIEHALFMTEEIDSTCDNITLKQWHEFCQAAQEMAWLDRSRNEILSAATYSSDDAYMRTTGYVIAEALNTDISPLNNPQFYNPFADQEKYERMHLKAAKELFEGIFAKAQDTNRPECLLEEALRLNTRLIKGEIIGWCAPALVKTCKAYSKDNIRLELLEELFRNVLHDTKWSDICALNRFITNKKRQDISITSDVVLNEFVKGKEELDNIREAFAAL